MRTFLTSLILFTVCAALRTQAQSQEAIQLTLNYEKLQQLEKILDNMYKGYKIISKGYNTIKNIAEGNFKLHEVFLDGLYQVNPVVRNYKRIPYIIQYQQFIMKEGRRAFDRFKNDPNLTVREVKYLANVYDYLLKQSLRNLDELLNIVTASRMRMSDEERLKSIDRIFEDMENQVVFVKHFSNSTQALLVQRAQNQRNIDVTRKLHGVNP